MAPVKNTRSRTGAVLMAVIFFFTLIIVVGVSALHIASNEALMTTKDLQRHQAFYLAEAGLARASVQLFQQDFSDIDKTDFGIGTYAVDIDTNVDPPIAVATGQAGTAQKQIQMELTFLARPYEEGIYAANGSGSDFVLMLRGQGTNADAVYGNILANGDVALYEDSQVNPPTGSNPYGLNGDVEATGVVDVYDSAMIAGTESEGVPPPTPPDLLAMEYDTHHTYNVAQIFDSEGASNQLPSDHELYNVILKNPSDRVTECATTVGDDYFLEPASGFVSGTQETSTTPLNLGDKTVYYVDGNVWIHSYDTYGFLLDGQSTVVATGNIYICDNTEYADTDSLLGLVALGSYDGADQLKSGGNIYFGDPRFGTTYSVAGLMFAANDFLYNTDSVTDTAQEPKTGFSIYGNMAALNQVSINRDWYTDESTGKARPAVFTTTDASPDTPQWIDVETGEVLTADEISGMRHYQMKVHYDDRVRDPETQPPALPEGKGRIFAGLGRWQEL